MTDEATTDESTTDESMTDESMTNYIVETFAEVETTEAFGFTFFFYGAERMVPFATLAASDTEHDRYSNLDRPGVYRLNIGVSRQTYESLFGSADTEPSEYDYTTLDRIMPHPEYAAQHFICVLSPSDDTLERVKELLAEAYGRARARSERAGEE